jgi:light-regulated signal transduction histidine kinase (bacteriophytochrome)
METVPLRVLLVEDNADHATLIQRHLSRIPDCAITVERAERLGAGLERLARGGIDAVLLDLRLPDSDGLETIPKVIAQAPQVPIVVLTSLDDLRLATRAVQRGAQDYLVKAQLTGEVLVRSLRYAIERKRAYAELERSNEDYRSFAHMVSHELKTPLSVVAYTYDLLKNKRGLALDVETREFLELGVDAVRQMNMLIDDLLAYARVDSRRQPTGRADCEAVLEQVEQNLQLMVAECGAKITHDPLPEITADASQLAQLFQNVIGNAIKYRCELPPRIHVAVGRDGPHWRFSIRDNGIGIDPRHAEKVFAIFERLHSDDRYTGTGIGLAICKRIVERHGGRIWVESQPGQGSTFHFTLPADDASAE